MYIGWAKEQVAYETRPFVHKELDILGSRNAMPEDFHDVIRMLEAKRFPVERLSRTWCRSKRRRRFWRQWSHEPARFTKIMVEVS